MKTSKDVYIFGFQASLPSTMPYDDEVSFMEWLKVIWEEQSKAQ